MGSGARRATCGGASRQGAAPSAVCGAAARPHPPMPPPVGCGHARGLEAARVCATEATSRARRLTPAPSPTTTTRGHGVEDGAVCGGDARRGAASPPPPMGGCRASPVWARGILLGPDLRSSAPCSSLLAPAPGDAHTAAGHRARARYGLGGGCSPPWCSPPRSMPSCSGGVRACLRRPRSPAGCSGGHALCARPSSSWGHATGPGRGARAARGPPALPPRASGGASAPSAQTPRAGVGGPCAGLPTPWRAGGPRTDGRARSRGSGGPPVPLPTPPALGAGATAARGPAGPARDAPSPPTTAGGRRGRAR